jgi:hypothetical protein
MVLTHHLIESAELWDDIRIELPDSSGRVPKFSDFCGEQEAQCAQLMSYNRFFLHSHSLT